jgi:hypothetical protein
MRRPYAGRAVPEPDTQRLIHDIGIDGHEKLSSAEVADQDDVAGRGTAGYNKLLAVC